MKKLLNFLTLNFGIILVTVGVYFFKIPNGFATGGVSGIATVLARLIKVEWLTSGMLILIMNAALLIVGFIFVNKSFGFKTVYCTLAYSLLTYLLEWLIPLTEDSFLPLVETVTKTVGKPETITYTLTNEPLLELVFAILLSAIGSAILFNHDASSGGTDIIAMIFKKYTAINVGTALLIADGIVAVSAFFVFGVKAGLFSILGLFAKSFLVDGIIESFNLCKYFTIITEKPDEICDYIMKEIHRGVTKHMAEGAFSHRNKTVILTVCRRYEARLLKAKIKEIDPSAFIMITNSSEIIGRGFRSV